tara:strand:- start:1645 stop:2394 length:750 start_codon:yes stop_codon:yes gene_type:complete
MMFELSNEYDITLVSDIGTEKRNALIIDNFYKNPNEVRNYCIDSPKKSKKTDPELIAGLPGWRVFEEDSRVAEKLKDQFSHWRDQSIWRSPNPPASKWWDENWNKTGFMCNVMNANTMDVGGGIPHQDSFNVRFGSVIYLNTPEECAGGTRLYSYMDNMSLYAPDIIDDGLRHQYNEITMNRWICDNDETAKTRDWVDGSNKDSPWKVEFEFEMVYNRCILYEADLLHSQWYSEGMFTDYDRICQVLFM